MPIITIVAKTGLLIETRVIHMAAIPRSMRRQPAACVRPDVGASPAPMPAPGAGAGALTIAGAPSFRLSKLRGEHRRVRRQRGLELDAPGRVVAAAGHDACA